jgi:hypothetical protein
MERRFKIAHVSYNDIAEHGKDMAKKVEQSLPKGSTVMRQEDDLNTASQILLVHNESFDLVPLGEECPKLTLTIAEDSVILTR